MPSDCDYGACTAEFLITNGGYSLASCAGHLASAIREVIEGCSRVVVTQIDKGV